MRGLYAHLKRTGKLAPVIDLGVVDQVFFSDPAPAFEMPMYLKISATGAIKNDENLVHFRLATGMTGSPPTNN